MDSLSVIVLTPHEGKVYEGPALELYVPSRKGPLGICPGYTSTVAPLVKGIARLKTPENRNFYFVISGGVLEVKPDKVYVLSESATRYENEEEAKAALTR
jgi:F-type H+-transporting ATPase subunit epsilon